MLYAIYLFSALQHVPPSPDAGPDIGSLLHRWAGVDLIHADGECTKLKGGCHEAHALIHLPFTSNAKTSTYSGWTALGLPIYSSIPGAAIETDIDNGCGECNRAIGDAAGELRFAATPWGRFRPEVPFTPLPPVLTFHRTNDQSSGLCMGSIQAVCWPNSEDPRTHTKLTDASITTGLEALFALPQELSAQPIDLAFSWDTHVSLDPNRIGVRLTTNRQRGVYVPLSLPPSEDPILIEPRQSTFQSGTTEGVEWVVRVIVPGRLVDQVAIPQYPACIAPVNVHASTDGATITLRDTVMGAALHRCDPLAVRITLKGDPKAYWRYIRFTHAPQVRSPTGLVILGGVFAPDEETLITLSEDKHYALAFPGRSSAVESFLAGSTVSTVGTFVAPRSSGRFALTIVTDNQGTVRIEGIVEQDVSREFARWLR